MILIITAVFPPEPVVSASMTLNLAEKLGENHEVTVISPAPSRPLGYDHKSQDFRPKNFKHVILNSFTYPKPNILGRMFESFSFGRQAVKYLKKHNQKISLCYVNAWPLISQYMIVKYLKSHLIPTITHVQDTYPESITRKIPLLGKLLNYLLLPVDRYILQNSERVITSANGIRNHLINTRGLDESKVSMVYNWRNDKRFIDFANLNEGISEHNVFTFMFLGNICRTAAVDILINSFFEGNLENAKLVIAGSGPEKENLYRLVQNFHSDNVEFWDAADKEVPEIQSKADVLVVSLKKNTAQFAVPSKLPAYMFSKKPIIACVESNSDSALIIEEAKCGWVVMPEDINALAKQMRYVAGLSKDELNRLGENGFKYAMNNFSTIANLHKLSSVFSEALNEEMEGAVAY